MSKKASNPPPIYYNSMVEKHLELLGLEVKDKVSDLKGIVISISFDLYGCIQADVRPKELDKDGKLQTGWWMDINRLIIKNKKPVMERPNYNYGHIADGGQGAAEKPSKR